MKNNQRNHSGTFLYLTQVKAVLFAVLSPIIGSLAPHFSKWHRAFRVINLNMRTRECTRNLSGAWHVMFIMKRRMG